MEAGIVGLPNVGKSTLYNALTAGGAEASNYPFCTIEPNTGVVPVPDQRLSEINQYIDTKEIVPAVLKAVDIAGIVKGANKGEGLGNKFLSHIREVDAILHVVRCFENENIVHVDGDIDPLRDIEIIESELLLADLEATENALTKARKQARSLNKEAKIREGLLERCQQSLQQGKPIRALEITDDLEKKALKTFSFLSHKKMLYLANVSEDDLNTENAYVQSVRKYAESQESGMVQVSAKIESELAELAPEERDELLVELGLGEPALHKVIRASYQLLELHSFFTAGPKEIRAWTVPFGAKAPQAAGVIHTDFERGFIRAEIYNIEELKKFESEAEIRAAGKLRVEGKDYVIKDGDICHFLFNV